MVGLLVLIKGNSKLLQIYSHSEWLSILRENLRKQHVIFQSKKIWSTFAAKGLKEINPAKHIFQPPIPSLYINWLLTLANFSITAFHLRSAALNDSFYLAGKLIHVFLKKITATQDIDISQIIKSTHLLLSSW